MRFALYIITLLASTQLFAQGFSDSTLMNTGVQYPRSELVAHDKAGVMESGERVDSKYLETISEWSNPQGNSRLFESKFTRPFSWIGRQIYLRVGSVSSPYTLRVNGVEVAQMQSGAMAAEFDITKCAVEGRNIVSIELAAESRVSQIEGWGTPSSPKIGEVYVVSQPTLMIRDVKVSTSVVGDKLYSQFEVAVKSHALNPRTSTIHYSLLREDGTTVSFGHKDITLKMRGEDAILFNVTTPKSEGWSAENPELLTLQLKNQHEGRYVEYHTYKIGLRAVDVDPQSGEFKINGESTTLRAKSVMPDITESQIEELKSKGYNAIRIAAAPYNRSIFEMSDRLGLYVISPVAINSSQAPSQITLGGNPSNDPRWWGAYTQRADVGYHTTQFYTSVIGFSLADSSANGYNLYESYLRLKQKGDSRPILYFESEGEWNSDKLQININ